MENAEQKFIPKYIRRKISEDEIQLTFTKSGKTYTFSREGVAGRQSDSFSKAAYADRSRIEKAILAELSKFDRQQNPNAAPTIRNVFVKLDANDPDELCIRYAGLVFDQIAEGWGDAPCGEQDEYSQLAETSFQHDVENTVYDQDMNRLDTADSYKVALVKNPDGGADYFYKTKDYANGMQIWRKALNPLVWYGTAK